MLKTFFTVAKLKELIFSPTTVLAIMLLLSLGYNKYIIMQYEDKVTKLNASLEIKESQYTKLSMEHIELAKINKRNAEINAKVIEANAFLNKKYIEQESIVRDIIVSSNLKKSILSDYSERMSEEMLISKPSMLDKRIRGATKKALTELNILTKT